MIHLLDTSIFIDLIRSRQVPVLYIDGPGLCRHCAEQATALQRQATPIGAALVSDN